jgi:hypothetical protein
MVMQARLKTQDVRPARPDKPSARLNEAGVAVAHVDPHATSVCSACGCSINDDDIDDTNGWRWYSDGQGGLHPVCATCPAPTSLVAKDA